MKKILIVLAVVAAVAIAWSIGFIQAQDTQTQQSVKFVTADSAKFTEVVPGVSKAILWGNDKTGSYGAFTKFTPGYDAGKHSHTNDVWLVVHKGAYIYKDDEGEKRVGPGGFIFVPGRMKHSSGGDAKEGALFYEESSGKFDLIPAK